MMAGFSTRSIKDILKEMAGITDQDWQKASSGNAASPELSLVELGLITHADLARAKAARWGLPFVELDGITPSREGMELLGEDVLSTGLVFPMEITPDTARIAIADPDRWQIRDVLARLLSPRRLELVVAAAPDIQMHIVATEEEEEQVSESEARELVEAPPVVRMVDQIVNRAIADGASDIHFGNWGMGFEARCRVDGRLQHAAPIPKKLYPGVISRLKVLANLDIAEHRLPQDGEIPWPSRQNRKWDIRIVTFLTRRGEGAVLRIFGHQVGTDLSSLGFEDEILAALDRLAHIPNGIVLVTGPTGSGKTTTLATLVRRIQTLRPDESIYTVEDPVENIIPGVSHIQVNPKAGLTFGRVLRSLLRADPDVILIGEIRDQETAQIAIQAALTGHLVLSTLHTNDAPGAVTRLLDMGVEPYLLADVLRAVLAQRLVRRICGRCRESTKLDPNDGYLAPGLVLESEWRGKGCSACRGGYRGRVAIGEILVVTPRLGRLIVERATADVLRSSSGMRSMIEDGYRKVTSGITTVGEVRRAVSTVVSEIAEQVPQATDPTVLSGVAEGR